MTIVPVNSQLTLTQCRGYIPLQQCLWSYHTGWT